MRVAGPDKPTQYQLIDAMAHQVMCDVANWWEVNSLRRPSLKDAIRSSIQSAMEESEDYEGQALEEGRISYRFQAKS